jgi:hypothetical protein
VVAEIQIGGHLVLDPVMAPVWAGVVMLALVGAMAMAAWRRPMPLARGRRVALIVLRALVVVALAMLLLKPEVQWQGRQEVVGEVAFLMDGSRSMAIRDAVVPEARPDKAGCGTPENVQEPVRGGSPEPPRGSLEDAARRGGSGDPPHTAPRDPPRTVSGDPPGTHTLTLAVSRLDAVRFAFLTAGKSYADLGAKWIINPYAFGTGTRPIGNFAPESADPRTDFAEALGAMVVRQERGTGPYDDKPSPLAAVVVISDGRATRSRGSAEEAARLLAERGAKVHTVAVGSDKPADLLATHKRAETVAGVEEPDFEAAEVPADHENLRRIAQAGGGTFREITGLRDLMADLAENLPPSYREIERRLPLAEGRVFLGIVVGLLAAEWVLRRRWGLV